MLYIYIYIYIYICDISILRVNDLKKDLDTILNFQLSNSSPFMTINFVYNFIFYY
jgi:hypothetical protein